MKWLLRVILFLFITGLFTGSFLFAYSYHRYHSVPAAVTVTDGNLYEIKPGTSLRAVKISTDEIDNVILIGAALVKGVEKKIKAGRYDIEGQTIAGILEKFVRGDVVQFPVTVQEGLTSWQVVQKLNKADNLSGTIDTVPAEGSLLPETYLYMEGVTRAE